MVSGHTGGGGGSSRRYHSGGAHARGQRGGAHPVGQAGLDETLLEKYRGVTAALSKPQERDEEKRNVHRVREYWLEHEAMAHLPQLLALKVPVATFEATFLQANLHNPKYARGTLRETMRAFFREHTDADGVRVLTLKLSERPVCAKPSKNILKRWNLGNGMLYFFYAAVGRSAPPTGDEILEPFYYQKRVDFVKRACGPIPAPAPTAIAIKPEPEQQPPAVKPAGGSTAFFAEQLSLHGARGRKRRRDEAAAGTTGGGVSLSSTPAVSPRGGWQAPPQHQQQQEKGVLPLSALQLPAVTPAGQPVTAPLPAAAEAAAAAEAEEAEPQPALAAVKPEPGTEPTAPVVLAEGPVEAEAEPIKEEVEEDAEAVAGLAAYLRAQVWAPVEPAAVAAAVRAGVWRRVASAAPAGGAGLEGCEGLDAETLGGYLHTTTGAGGEEGRAGEAADDAAAAAVPTYRWVPDLAQLEAWSFENGALPAFVRACRLNWGRVAPAWRGWNEDLGNNALEWTELWRVGLGGPPEAAWDAPAAAEAAGGEGEGEDEEEDPFAAGAGTSMGGLLLPPSGKGALALMPFAAAAAAGGGASGEENAAVGGGGGTGVGMGMGLLGLTQNKAVPPSLSAAFPPAAAVEDVFLVDLSQDDAADDAYLLRPKIELDEEEDGAMLPQGVSAGSCDSVDSAATAAAAAAEEAAAAAAAYWAVGGADEEDGGAGAMMMDLGAAGDDGGGPLGLTDAELQMLFGAAGLDGGAEGPPAGAGAGAAALVDPSVVVGPLAPPVVRPQESLGATAMVANALF